jgi:hypothetical protein
VLRPKTFIILCVETPRYKFFVVLGPLLCLFVLSLGVVKRNDLVGVDDGVGRKVVGKRWMIDRSVDLTYGAGSLRLVAFRILHDICAVSRWSGVASRDTPSNDQRRATCNDPIQCLQTCRLI